MFSAPAIKQLIEEAIPACTAHVFDDANDGEHFRAEVVSASFEGKSLPAQHRMVYAALGARMGREIHALALRTFTPDQYAS